MGKPELLLFFADFKAQCLLPSLRGTHPPDHFQHNFNTIWVGCVHCLCVRIIINL